MTGTLNFDHIHLISADPDATSQWYSDVLGAEIIRKSEVRGAIQISVRLGGATLLVRGQRAGEDPSSTGPMQHFADFSSHNEWGTDHFGYTYQGDLYAYAEELKAKGATFSVEPYDFSPGAVIGYISAPDGVSIELVQAK